MLRLLLFLILTSIVALVVGQETKVSNLNVAPSTIPDTVVVRKHHLREIIVSPSKRAQSITKIPQQVALLKSEATKIFQAQTSADLVGTSGEVYIQKSQMGGGSPMMRGFSANRILLVIDGVRMNNATYRSGNLQNIISIDASTVDNAEIIFGPGSVIYGSDALGGVIHFRTLKPTLSTDGIKMPINISTRFSSANLEKTTCANFNIGGKKWAALTSVTYSDFENLLMGNTKHDEYTRKEYAITRNETDDIVQNPKPNKQMFTEYSQLNTMQKLRFRPNEKADFEYAFHFSKTSEIPRYDRLIEYSGTKLKFAEWYYGPQQWIMHSIKASFTGNGPMFDNINIIGAYQDYTESRNDRKFGKNTLNSRTENVDVFSINADADLNFSKTQALYYGVEGIINKIGSKALETNITDNSTKNISTRYPNGSNWWSLAVYSMYNQELNKTTTLQTGVRYNFCGMSGEFDNSVYGFPFTGFRNTDGALTVNFGMVFGIGKNNRLNINGATGFRSPNIDDAAKIFDSEPGTVMVPNPNLEPEYASTLELGWYLYPTEKLNIEINTYTTRLYNAMIRRNGTLNGNDSIVYDGEMSKVIMLTNTSWANIIGASGKVIIWPSEQLTLKIGANWQSGHDNDGLPVRHVAPFFGELHVIYKMQKIIFDLYSIFNGQISYKNLAAEERAKPSIYSTDKDGNPYSPAWYTVNIKTRYKASKSLSINAGAENLLNVRYRTYSSGIVAPGLNIIISFELNF